VRIAILVIVVLLIPATLWLLLGKYITTPPQMAGTLYQGAGETNLDLQSPDNVLLMDVPTGRVVIQMRPDLAPKHVQRIKELVRAGHYDGLSFHRVIDGFMAQGGDPSGTGQGGTGITLPAEFSTEPFVRGVVGMARAQSEDSADSQFFIMLDEASWLRGKYTVWGSVVEGMAHIDAIKKGDERTGKIDGEPDKMLKLTIKGDVAETN